MKKNLKKILLCFALVLVSLLTTFTIPQSIANASISIDYLSKYTNVLEDLESDSNFNPEDYPTIVNNYSLQVINIAESSDNELFVYVYQPSEDTKNIVASTINISRELHNQINVKNYKLSLLSSDGVFYKYKVLELEVDTTQNPRYYEIISIFRVFDETIDENKEEENDNTIDEVVYKVAKQYTVHTNSSGSISYSCAETDVVEVTDKFIGFVRYKDGFHLYPNIGACDSHFIAFSTDYEIDRLYEADVYYTSQSYQDIWVYNVAQRETIYGEKLDNYAYLNYQQHGSCTTNGIGGQTYDWNVISTVDEFVSESRDFEIYTRGIFDVSSESICQDEDFTALQEKEWVLRFTATEYNFFYTSAQQRTDKTIVGDVSILRLKFETDGKVYNLGVVDNKQTGSEDPYIEIKPTLKPNDMFKILVAILLLIVLLVVFAPFLPSIISFVLWLIKLVFKILLWIVSIPIKIINLIFKKK